MNPTRLYDYLCGARAKVLDKVRLLAPDQYTRTFEIGLGSLARTLTHIEICESYYVLRMLGSEPPPYEQWVFQDERPPTFAILEAHWKQQEAATRAAITSIRDWDAPNEYRYTADDGAKKIATASPADQFTQLFQHEVHHRAQAINMLRQLGVAVGDVDFNALMFARRNA